MALLLEEKASVDEKTGWEPVAESRFSQVTEVNVSSSVSMFSEGTEDKGSRWCT